MHEMSTVGRTGFSRKSIAPCLSAYTDAGTSPCAVSTMMGSEACSARRRSRTSMPLSPCRRRSRTRQPGRSGAYVAKNSRPDAKVSAWRPAVPRSVAIDVRSAGSSSTTKTVAELSVIARISSGSQETIDPSCERLAVFLQMLACARVDERARVVEQRGRGSDVCLGLLNDGDVEEDQRLAEMMVGTESADRTGADADDGPGLPLPHAGPVRSRSHVDGVLQAAGNRAIVLRGRKEHGIGTPDAVPEGDP